MVFTAEEVERLAAAEHERFRRSHPDGSASVIVAYADLSEEMRDANRSSVLEIPAIVAGLGYRLERCSAGRPSVLELDDAEIEVGARHEHERWQRWMRSRGYRRGPVRDEGARTHPDLVSWSELDEDAREKDRERVRSIPTLVALVDMQLLRDEDG